MPTTNTSSSTGASRREILPTLNRARSISAKGVTSVSPALRQKPPRKVWNCRQNSGA